MELNTMGLYVKRVIKDADVPGRKAGPDSPSELLLRGLDSGLARGVTVEVDWRKLGDNFHDVYKRLYNMSRSMLPKVTVRVLARGGSQIFVQRISA